MTDVGQLDEALAEWSHSYESLEPVLDAARAYRNLLSNGERVEWCETHEARYHDGAPGCGFWMFAKVVQARCGAGEPRPCSIVSRLLVDPPKEEDR